MLLLQLRGATQVPGLRIDLGQWHLPAAIPSLTPYSAAPPLVTAAPPPIDASIAAAAAVSAAAGTAVAAGATVLVTAAGPSVAARLVPAVVQSVV